METSTSEIFIPATNCHFTDNNNQFVVGSSGAWLHICLMSVRLTVCNLLYCMLSI